MLARTGDPDGAVDELAAALAAGFSYAGSQLREDEDLAALWQREEFRRLARISAERHAARALGEAPPLAIEEPPGEARGLLIALHGNHSSAADAAPHWSAATRLGWRVALAESCERTADGAVWSDRARAERQLARQIGELGARGPMVLAGFSRGAELALWLAMTGAIEAVGCILVAPSPNAAEFYRSAMTRRVRVWMALGQEDAMYLERGVALAEALRDGGLDCRAETVAAMGHEFPAGFGEELLPGALELVGG